MLEITADDIAALSDDDLRTLVGLLCEADLRKLGHATTAATWGGNQNAPDGGIDVRVSLLTGAAIGGCIPKRSMGYQVKKTDFTPALIRSEMRPGGVVRPSIRSLVEQGGAYIIVSSGTHASDSALADRRATMRAAVADIDPGSSLTLDFFDRNRIATWTREHPGLLIWVRNKAGRVISGWKSYDAWAFSPDGIKDELLLDDHARLHDGMRDQTGVAITEGIQRMRTLLRSPRTVIRLAGLSGVGKTRLVQALFDDRVGEKALDPSQAVYSDISDDPDPQPIAMAHSLISMRQRAIVIVDNCAPELHRRLSELCRTQESTISVVTVEYDIRDDEPEGTEVFLLQPSSPELVTKLIRRRFSQISEIDARTIGTFSGGNARVAIALANTLERNESLADLREEELLVRLFHQRHVQDDTLFRAAQACSLLYSFEGVALDGKKAELPLLGNLVNLSASELFAKVAALRQRQLVQQRGPWRAVLPHAIANRLAALALKSIPVGSIEAQFTTDRTMRSFTRRLGFLHDSPEAVQVADKWLGTGGILENVGRLNDLGDAMFANIAPISPETTLSAIERALSGPDSDSVAERNRMSGRIAMLLRSLAYDAALFDRCTRALITLAMSEPEDSNRQHAAQSALKGLFLIVLSGTHASVEQRVAVLTTMLQSANTHEQRLGVKLLDAMLEASHFSSGFSFEFGARKRDYGFWPKTGKDTNHWYLSVLSAAVPLACSDLAIAPAVRDALAGKFRGLWYLSENIRDELDKAARDIHDKDFWQKGWISVRIMLAYPREKAPSDFITRLEALEQVLKPTNLVQSARAVLGNNTFSGYDIADAEADDENPSSSYERANASAQSLGRQIAVDDASLSELLPDLFAGGSTRTQFFGMGIASSSVNPEVTWNVLAKACAELGDKANIGVLAGFLMGLNKINSQLCEKLLDDALTDDALTKRFAALQTSVPTTERGLVRLHKALTDGKAYVGDFRHLGWSGSDGIITPANLRDLALEIAQKPSGYEVASEIIFFRIFGLTEKKEEIPFEWLEAGRALLRTAQFNDKDQSADFRLGILIRACLAGAGNEEVATHLCELFKEGVENYSVYSFHFTNVMQALFKVQPSVALDVFFSDSESDLEVVDDSIFDDPSDSRENPLSQLSDDEVLTWCGNGPSTRYVALARAVPFFIATKDKPLEWSSVALKLLDASPDPFSVLDVFIGRFQPRSWSGSRAEIVETGSKLLAALFDHPKAAVSAAAKEKAPLVQASVVQERAYEAKRDRDRDERFE